MMPRVLVVMAVVAGWLAGFGLESGWAMYVDNGDTVTDTATGLEWQQPTAGYKIWDDAMQYADSLTLNDKTDWRLPTIDELLSLIRLDVTYAPYIDHDFFPDTQMMAYWTSEEADSYSAWYVHFGGGPVAYQTKAITFYVRAVREILHNLVISRTGTGSGNVTSSPAGIDCGVVCAESYHYNIPITLTAVPDHDSTFTGWDGDADCVDGLVAMTTSDVACTATFTVSSFTVTPGSGSHGGIAPAVAQTVSYGNTATFTVTPELGYTTSVGGTCGGVLDGNIYTTSAITTACTVNAAFYFNAHAVTATAGTHGTISPLGTQAIINGDPTHFTVTPEPGYTASVGGTCGGELAGNIYTTSAITSACTVVASFSQNSYTLTYAAGANGAISGDTPQTVSYGTSGTAVTAMADSGYHFVKWSDDSTTNPRTDANVSGNISVIAVFKKTFPWMLLAPAVTNGELLQEEASSPTE